jgi:hypothetical protein
MIVTAREPAGSRAADQGRPLHYRVAGLSNPDQLPSGRCEGAVAVFLINWLSIKAME